MQDGPAAAHALLPDEGAGALLVVLPVQAGAAGAGADAGLVLLTWGAAKGWARRGDGDVKRRGNQTVGKEQNTKKPFGFSRLRQKLCRLQLMHTWCV